MPANVTARSTVQEVQAAANLTPAQWRYFLRGTTKAATRLQSSYEMNITSWMDVKYLDQQAALQEVRQYLEEQQVSEHKIDIGILDWRMNQIFKERRGSKRTYVQSDSKVAPEKESLDTEDPVGTLQPSSTASQRDDGDAEVAEINTVPSKPFDPVRDIE